MARNHHAIVQHLSIWICTHIIIYRFGRCSPLVVVVFFFCFIRLNRNQNAIWLLLSKWLFGQTAINCVAIYIFANIMNVKAFAFSFHWICVRCVSHARFCCFHMPSSCVSSVPRAVGTRLYSAHQHISMHCEHFLLLIRSLNHMIHILLLYTPLCALTCSSSFSFSVSDKSVLVVESWSVVLFRLIR